MRILSSTSLVNKNAGNKLNPPEYWKLICLERLERICSTSITGSFSLLPHSMIADSTARRSRTDTYSCTNRRMTSVMVCIGSTLCTSFTRSGKFCSMCASMCRTSCIPTNCPMYRATTASQWYAIAEMGFLKGIFASCKRVLFSLSTHKVSCLGMKSGPFSYGMLKVSSVSLLVNAKILSPFKRPSLVGISPTNSRYFSPSKELFMRMATSGNAIPNR